MTNQSCHFSGCARQPYAHQLCNAHYQQERRGQVLAPLRIAGKVCEFNGCTGRHKAHGLCVAHYTQQQRGVALKPVRAEAQGHLRDGYRIVYAKDHPNAWKNGQVYEHTLVMSEVLGRPLLPGENVHHKNGDRSDNRPENLELWITKQPKGQRPEDLVAWAEEVLALYKPLP